MQEYELVAHLHEEAELANELLLLGVTKLFRYFIQSGHEHDT